MQKIVRTKKPEVEVSTIQLSIVLSDITNKIIVIVNKQDYKAYFVMQDKFGSVASFSGFFSQKNFEWHASLKDLMKKYDDTHDFYIFDSFHEAIRTISEKWAGCYA